MPKAATPPVADATAPTMTAAVTTAAAPTRGGRKGQNPSLPWCAMPAPAPKVVTPKAATPRCGGGARRRLWSGEQGGTNDQSSAQGRGGSGVNVASPDQGGGPDPDGFEGGSERTFMGQVATTLAEATPRRQVTN
jgi:hypothetical protein